MIEERVSVLCDDVRPEAGNKLSLMGIYIDNLQVPEFGMALPKLVLFKSLTGGAQGATYDVSVNVLGPDGNPLLPGLSDRTTEVVADATKAWNLVIGLAPFPLPAPGPYTFQLTIRSRRPNEEPVSLEHVLQVAQAPA